MCNCCFGNIEGESCGWPKGTVRAVIALISIPLAFIASVAVMIVLIVKEQYTIALGINSGIWAIIGTIIGYYFGSKQAEGAAKLISDVEHDLIRSLETVNQRNNEQPNRVVMNENDVVIDVPL